MNPESENSFGVAQSNFATIDIVAIFKFFWGRRINIIAITSLSAIISVIYALSLTNIYRAEAVLAPADTEQSGMGVSNQLGGAASLLGINVAPGADRTINSIALLQSREFLGRFITEHDVALSLFATNWSNRLQTSVVDDSIFDETTGEWLTRNGPPTQLQAIRRFRTILEVSGPDRITGLITIAVRWQDPNLASQWVNQLISDLNREIRTRDVTEAENAIQYLRRQLDSTQLVDMQRVFYQLIESQTRISMLADVREEYVFQVIDPAVAPDQKFSPRRSIICIFGTMLGFLLSLGIVFFQDFYQRRKKMQLM